MHRFWLIKNDMITRIDLPNKESPEFKFLSESGWKLKNEELICTDIEMYQFLDKNGPSDFDTIRQAFKDHKDEDLRHALGVLIYTDKSVDTMNGINGRTGMFVTARHQKNWAAKIQKSRNENKPVSICDIPSPDVDPVSTCNKTKVLDTVNVVVESTESTETENKASIDLPKVAQKVMRRNIIEKSTKENLHNFDAFINGLGNEYKCYWNEYLDDFKRKLILTEIKKKYSQ